MAHYLATFESNHWSFGLLLFIGVLTYGYVTYFFFSKEGRDERGRGIFASASALTFLLMFIISEIYDYKAEEWILRPEAFILLNWIKLSSLGLCQTITILVLRKRR